MCTFNYNVSVVLFRTQLLGWKYFRNVQSLVLFLVKCEIPLKKNCEVAKKSLRIY